MKKHNSKPIRRRAVSLTAALLFLTALTGVFSYHLPAAAADVRRFDLGGNAQSGWTSVSASDGYNKSKGFGFR